MQFTVNNTALVEALGWVAKSLPARPSAPVLAGVKMSVESGFLTLAAFDYEQSAIATIEVDSVTDGTVVVSGRLLADIARALPKGDVKFELDGTKIRVQAKSSKFSLQTMPVADYPTLPDQPTMIGSVDANLFAEAIRSVVPAAGRDDMLPVLTAVNVVIDPAAGELTLVATDRFRLAVRKVSFQGEAGAEPLAVLVPARVLDTWAKSLTGEAESRFTFGTGGNNENVFAVQADHRSATVRLLDGQYPKWEALIPRDFTAEAVVETAEVADAVKRVSLVAEKSTPATLAFSANGLVLSAEHDDEATEDVDAQYVGGDITIGFNFAFLLDGLNAVGGTARISLVAGNKPAVIRPVDGEDTYTYLLMPMRGGR